MSDTVEAVGVVEWEKKLIRPIKKKGKKKRSGSLLLAAMYAMESIKPP